MPHLELFVTAGMEIVGFLFVNLPEDRDYMQDPVWMRDEDDEGEEEDDIWGGDGA